MKTKNAELKIVRSLLNNILVCESYEAMSQRTLVLAGVLDKVIEGSEPLTYADALVRLESFDMLTGKPARKVVTMPDGVVRIYR